MVDVGAKWKPTFFFGNPPFHFGNPPFFAGNPPFCWKPALGNKLDNQTAMM
jgi:hypothetical protein